MREWLTGNQLYFDIRKEYGIVLYFNKKEDKALEILEVRSRRITFRPVCGTCTLVYAIRKLKDFEMSKQYLEPRH
jgi:arginyl-tRNA--protein-N-Asp/Glu arginylyltransferase